MTQWGLDTLFNPAKRHMDEEKQRLQSTREEVGDNSGGRRIDLDSGRVTIPRGEDGDEAAPAKRTKRTVEEGKDTPAARAAARRAKKAADSTRAAKTD